MRLSEHGSPPLIALSLGVFERSRTRPSSLRAQLRKEKLRAVALMRGMEVKVLTVFIIDGEGLEGYRSYYGGIGDSMCRNATFVFHISQFDLDNTDD